MNEKITQALDYIGQDQWLKAKDILQDLIAQEPETEIFYELYGYCLRRLETEDFGEYVPRSQKEEDPHLAKIRQKAEALSKAGNYRSAEVVWQMLAHCMEKKLTENPPARTGFFSKDMLALAQTYRAQAMCGYLRGDLSAAKENFSHSKEIELHTYRDLPVSCAKIYAEMRDFAQADNILLTALEESNEGVLSYEVHRARAEIFEKSGPADLAKSEYEVALSDLEEQVAKEPLDMRFYPAMADVLDKLGRTEEALKANAKAVALWSTYPKTYFQRAKLLAARKDEKGALKQVALGKLCEVYYPGEYFLDEGEVYERLGRWSKAEACYLAVSSADARYEALKRLYTRRNTPKKLEKYVSRMKNKKTPFWDRVSEIQLAEELYN